MAQKRQLTGFQDHVFKHQYILCHWGSVMVKALRYKSEGPGIDLGRASIPKSPKH